MNQWVSTNPDKSRWERKGVKTKAVVAFIAQKGRWIFTIVDLSTARNIVSASPGIRSYPNKERAQQAAETWQAKCENEI